MNNNRNIKEQIIDFYNDSLFQELKAYYGKTTLFNILKIERNENRHSAFLAWLLDENGSHGLGEEPLKRFMRLLAKMDDKYNEPFLVGNYQVENAKIDTEHPVSIGSKKGRIDVFIEFDYKGENGTNHVHVIIENKVYTNEHDEQTKLYLDWARKEYKGKHNQNIIGVFLAPDCPEKCSGDTKDFSYVKITYQDILQDLIEPLLKMEMSPEARVFITDYVINLGQPLRVKKEDNGNKEVKEDTILALSKENKDRFSQLYEKYAQLLDATLCAYSKNKNNAQSMRSLYGDERYCEIEHLLPMNGELLNSFWESNNRMIRMILDNGLVVRYPDKSKEISELLNIKGNKNQKFLFDGQTYEVKARLCHAVIKYYVEKHQEATIDDLQKVFNTKVKNEDKVVATLEEALQTQDSNKKAGGNYFMKKEDRILLKNNNVVVWNYWPDRFFVPFMENVRSLNIVVEEIE